MFLQMESCPVASPHLLPYCILGTAVADNVRRLIDLFAGVGTIQHVRAGWRHASARARPSEPSPPFARQRQRIAGTPRLPWGCSRRGFFPHSNVDRLRCCAPPPATFRHPGRFRLGSYNSADRLLTTAGPPGSGASARRWGPPQPTTAAGAEPAAPNTAAAPAVEAVRETGTIASLKPHYGFIRLVPICWPASPPLCRL